jgi:hypothetical protein
MTSAWDEAIQRLKALPDHRQQELPELILALAGDGGRMPVIAY